MEEKVQPLNLKTKDICEVLFESATEGLLVVDSDGTIQITNPALNQMFDYKGNELIGKNLEILIPEVSREKHVENRKEYLKNPEKRPMSSDHCPFGRKKNGSVFPIALSLNHFTTEGHQLVMALISEISERKLATDKLAINEFFLNETERLSGIGHYEVNFETQDVMWSDHVFRLCGLNSKYAKTPTIKDSLLFIHADDRRLVYDTYKKCIDNENPFDFEYRIVRTDGEIRYIRNTGFVNNKDSNQNPTTIFGIVQDLTNQKNIEHTLLALNVELEQRVDNRTKALKESQHLYKMIALNFPNGEISVLDKNLNYVFVEGMELHKRGITGEMLIGSNFLHRIDHEIREDVQKKLMKVFNGTDMSFELKTRNKTYMISAVELHEKNEDINQILIVSQNITKLKKAEEDIQRSLDKEIRLNELKSRFVSMASHEFRTPLTTILNSLTILSRYIGVPGQEEKQQKNISRIKVSIHHLTNILNDFLSLDKLEEGNIGVNNSEFNFPEFAMALVESLRAITKKGQQINYKHSGEISVYMDMQMLKNIFNNLISNAVKYSPENSPIYVKTTIKKGLLTIVIVDKGIGIPTEEQGHMFERFFRAKNALHIQGTGLGLNIVKKYVEMIDGEIKFNSEPEKGTTFTIKMPLINSH
jgi:PAS domain S-box-containing protein